MDFSLENIAIAVVLLFTINGWLIALGIRLNYGRLKNSVTKLEINPKIAWFLFEVPNLLWAFYFLFIKGNSLSFPYLLFIAHYINRDIIYPLRLKTTTKVPLQITLAAFLFTSANGYLQGLSNEGMVEGNMVLKVVGFVLFCLGMWINIKSDNILQKAKEKSCGGEKKDLEEGKHKKYVRIDDFLFKYVGSPNYFGQVIEWFGYFLLSQNIYSFMFAFSTLNILTAGAIPRNKWNRENLIGYPKERKAIIPFVI